jgi:hypothetical protein
MIRLDAKRVNGTPGGTPGGFLQKPAGWCQRRQMARRDSCPSELCPQNIEYTIEKVDYRKVAASSSALSAVSKFNIATGAKEVGSVVQAAACGRRYSFRE